MRASEAWNLRTKQCSFAHRGALDRNYCHIVLKRFNKTSSHDYGEWWMCQNAVKAGLKYNSLYRLVDVKGATKIY
jgi:hypothetical protein